MHCAGRVETVTIWAYFVSRELHDRSFHKRAGRDVNVVRLIYRAEQLMSEKLSFCISFT